ncbi:hypothetical protein [Methylobacterium gnaphalii]|uniref:Uncharacterized protein n=1 Tax=Methylobacterium gnaphalii TaxID=1010610 RepID=A0A512JPG6_9HYPH|nr:hypothetical protein [Methylobacterium gnaphalii]GEP11854.1 hypothetical protein MGN01_36990 [Methylobacterium gnaphalii]GJD71631.1 hypothetical protein MMMDOFMJ_4594 [Methylobacterium gnaphalii]GLS47174.1 hypothetical protein GCM10007885_00160 [Methylobacterium gnaphalii]
MVSFLRAAVLTVALLPVLSALPAVAAQRELFEKVNDWEVERTVGDTSAHPCLISKTYKDREDHNLVNGIVFSLDGADVALALVYQGWEWDKGEKVKANFLAGKKVLKKQVSWNADAQVLAAGFPNSIVPDLLSAETLVLKFEDGDADFDITGFPQAYEALHRCDATPAKAAAAKPATPAAKAPVVPAETRIQAYAFGLMLQDMFKSCDFATTGKQRTAVDAKVASMQPEMAVVENVLREKLKSQAPACPKATDEAEVQSTIKDFVELSPEAFSAAMDKKSEEKVAKAEAAKAGAPKTETPKADAPATEAPKP